METIPREILICHAKDGRKPFLEWLNRLDAKSEAIVLDRIDRVEDGNFGDVAPIGEGLSELRVHSGPGYRIYFGQIGNQVHLIGGGSKQNQQRDIAAAKRFWRERD
jgi:putative addiction module killer protein